MRLVATLAALLAASPALAATDTRNPSWWNKYQFLLNNAQDPFVASPAASTPTNVDVSNECGPQSETFIAINPARPRQLAAGSNEIFRDPMRGYFSSDGGSSWGGVDLPLPAAIGTNGIRFGSDPTLAFDSAGRLYYGYIVVFFGGGAGINGTEMAVARSLDGGQTYAQATFFDFQGGSNHFNDKPMITADANPGSPFRDNVYIAWDAASGGSATGGGIRVARSTDKGATFTSVRADDPSGPGRSIGATVTTGPKGQVYVAWNDYAANTIVFNSSSDGGASFAAPRVIAAKSIPFDIAIPAESFRRALVYPACDADRSSGPNRGRISCAWMDLKANGNTDIFASVSDDGGTTWSAPRAVTDGLGGVDRFNHWLATDPVTGQVDVSFYDTRNDTTGSRFMTDVYLSRGDGVSFGPNQRVSDVSSNEHDCNGVFPCSGIDYGNQQGDYEGVAAYGGTVHSIWTDSRRNLVTAPGCASSLMEEVFTAAVK